MANRWRTLTTWHGRIYSDSIADLWSTSLTSQDPPIPNLALETPSVGGSVTGTLSASLGALTLSGDVDVLATASATPTLGALVQSAAATVTSPGVTADLSVSLGAITLAAVAGVSAEGDFGSSLGTLTAAGTAQVTSPLVRRYYRGRPSIAGAVMLSRNFYYVDEEA